jgi:hypothetical protein
MVATGLWPVKLRVPVGAKQTGIGEEWGKSTLMQLRLKSPKYPLPAALQNTTRSLTPRLLRRVALKRPNGKYYPELP